MGRYHSVGAFAGVCQRAGKLTILHAQPTALQESEHLNCLLAPPNVHGGSTLTSIMFAACVVWTGTLASTPRNTNVMARLKSFLMAVPPLLHSAHKWAGMQALFMFGAALHHILWRKRCLLAVKKHRKLIKGRAGGKGPAHTTSVLPQKLPLDSTPAFFVEYANLVNAC